MFLKINYIFLAQLQLSNVKCLSMHKQQGFISVAFHWACVITTKNHRILCNCDQNSLMERDPYAMAFRAYYDSLLAIKLTM